jgi:HK97 family phage prohead protease
MNKETRAFDGSFEVRKADDGKMTIRGMAAVYNTSSEKMWNFYERIMPGAFDEVLGNDVRGLFNHDPNFILGRTKAGTLRLEATPEGLAYEIDLPDTTAARDLMTSIDRGDVTQSSFAFVVGREKWVVEGDDEYREIEKVSRLYDVSPVTYPAYPDTSVAKRSYEQWKEEHTPPAPEPEPTPEPEDPRAALIRMRIKSASQPEV